MTGSWKDLWTHAPKLGHRCYCVDGTTAIAIGLMYSGYNENSVVPAQLAASVKALDTLKPIIGGFESINTIQILGNGQAWMIPTYTGNVYTAILESKGKNTLQFELCKEGQLFNADNLSVPIHAQHPGNGALFIDWMLATKQMIQNVAYIGYPVPTTAALAEYDKLVTDYPFLEVGTDFIDNVTSGKGWQGYQSPADLQALNAAWTQVLA
jgi:spermidine/putrescine-binding protein